MLLRDLALYRTLLLGLSWEDLIVLYERTCRDQPALARAISEELDGRIAENGGVGR